MPTSRYVPHNVMYSFQPVYYSTWEEKASEKTLLAPEAPTRALFIPAFSSKSRVSGGKDPSLGCQQTIAAMKEPLLMSAIKKISCQFVHSNNPSSSFPCVLHFVQPHIQFNNLCIYRGGEHEFTHASCHNMMLESHDLAMNKLCALMRILRIPHLQYTCTIQDICGSLQHTTSCMSGTFLEIHTIVLWIKY